MNISKSKVAVALSLFSAVNAYALVPESAITTQQFQVKVTETLPAVSFNVTPGNALETGTLPSGTTLANATLSLGGKLGKSQYAAIRFDPTKGTQDPMTAAVRTYSGKANAANKLTVGFSSNILLSPGNDGWVVFSNNSDLMEYNIAIKTQGQQNVAPDTYTMYVDAGIYAI